MTTYATITDLQQTVREYATSYSSQATLDGSALSEMIATITRELWRDESLRGDIGAYVSRRIDEIVAADDNGMVEAEIARRA